MKARLSDRQARVEAERCLGCFDAPCTAACPAQIDIPGFIAMVRSGNPIGAAEVVRSSNALANVCGKVCPQEVFCQASCTRAKQDTPIAIRALHYYATQKEVERGHSLPRTFEPNGKSAGVVGGGPAGLSCAFALARLGYRVDLYDRRLPGGVPGRSIPSYRLSGEDVRSDLDFISRFVGFHQEEVGRASLIALEKRHDALFIGVGLGVDRKLPLPGANLPGVVPVLDFLESAREGRNALQGERVVIVGGGNVSLDAAATTQRMGYREVVLIYRRGEKEMRVWTSEREEARGVQMLFFTSPVEIIGPDRVRGVRCRRTRLSDRLDATGRPLPVEIEGSEFVLECDAVITAIGQIAGGELLDLFERTAQGRLKVDHFLATSRPGVFAGGDCVGGEGTIVQSVADGKNAAASMHRYITRGSGG